MECEQVGVGSVLKERFVLEALIARGGMGVVYKACDLRKREAHDREPYIAVKVLTEDFKQHPDALISLQREAKKAQQLAHPNIVTVYDFDRDGETVFMTMEYLEGESLSALIKRTAPVGLARDDAMAIIDGMCQGLAYAHKKNIVHSDFKPGNVFVCSDDTVKVLDFGIARAAKIKDAEQQEVTLFDAGALGALTPAYASCEMLEQGDPDPRDDVYALACVAYELLAGHHPFRKSPSTQARDNGLQPPALKSISRGQWRALLHGLTFEREQRTLNAAHFWQELALESALTPPLKSTPSISSNTKLIAGAALAALLILWLLIERAEQVFGPARLPQSNTPVEQITPAALDPETQAKVESMLEVADVHQIVGRLVVPPGSNAYETYMQVLKINPGNRRAEAGLLQIADKYYEQARSNLNAGGLAKSAALVAAGLEISPGHAGLLAVQRQLQQGSEQ